MNNFDNKSVLLAEDDPNDVELTLAALKEHKLANRVVVVQDGAEALDYLYRKGRFSDRPAGNPIVVLLDLKMPKVDGLEVLRQIKHNPAFKSIPVVVLTSSRQDQDIIESYQLGVNAYVVKPVAFAEFVKSVQHIGLFWMLTNEPPAGTLDQLSG